MKEPVDKKAIEQINQALEARAAGELAVAESILLELIQAYPNFAAAYNNLGAIYFLQQKWEKAAEAWQSAINVQADFTDAYYNLGLAQLRQNKLDQANVTFKALLRLNPEHAAALFHLASIWMKQGNYGIAAPYFHHILKHHPEHLESKINLAACCLKLGDLPGAEKYYSQALSISPEDSQLYFNLGVIQAQQGLFEKALEYYDRALSLAPDYFEAWNNAGVACLAMQHQQDALRYFNEAKKRQPDNQSIRYLVQMLSQKDAPGSSPPEYISSLFDSYAEHYEPHLQQVLHYAVPTVFQRVLDKYKSKMIKNQLDILDMGCGTGLCAPCVKAFSRKLTGVDLSGKMLEQAESKALYDELVLADYLSFLSDKEACYDLVLAGDVLVYSGDLSPLFATVKKALRPGGLFLFNVEISDKQDYYLASNGRFAHSRAYLEKLGKLYAFHILDYQAVILREQLGQPVKGHVYLMQR